MEDLNNVPSTGTFGNSIGQVNQNFGLVKGAIENLEGRTIRSKGLFPTQAALTTAYPSPKVGDYAYVGSGLPATIYDCLAEGTWHNTGQTGGSETVDLNNYSTKSETSASAANSLAQATARTGYGEATASNNAYSVAISNYTMPTNGGNIRVKMPSAATGAATLKIGDTDAKTLWYNGSAVSSQNTWGAEEIISVYYDGSVYQATNAQGGGGKAEKIKYNNSQSGLVAENVQEALDGIADDITHLNEIDISNYKNIGGAIGSDNKWTKASSSSTNTHILIPVAEGETYKLIPNIEYSGTSTYAWLTSTSVNYEELAPLVAGTSIKNFSKEISIVPPTGSEYLYVRTGWAVGKYRPSYFGIYKSIKDKLEEETSFSSGEKVSSKGIDNEFNVRSNNLSTSKAVFDGIKGMMQPFSLNLTNMLEPEYRLPRWTDVTNFSNKTTGTHVVIPVENSYEQLKFIAHATNPSFFVFVKSYEEPTSAAAYDLCDGETGRRQQNAGTGAYYDIPGDCRYIIIGIQNDSVKSYKPREIGIVGYSNIDYASKFNDLYINTLRTTLEDTTVSTDEYWGDRINVSKPNRSHTCSHYTSEIDGIGSHEGQSQQGLAIYGKYAFITYNHGYVVIYDLTTKELVNSYQMPDAIFGSQNHAGNANFSEIFYDGNDQFPLLYVSNHLRYCCYVLRVSLESCELIQTLYASQDGSETIEHGIVHFYPDNDGRMILHGSLGFYLVPAIPQVTAGTSYIDLSKCIYLGYREVSQGYALAGAAARNGNLYMNAYTSGNYSTMLVYNYEQRRLASKLTLPSSLHSREFEGLGFYEDNTIIIGYNSWNKLVGFVF